MIISVYLRGAMEAHQTSNLGVLSSSLSEDVFILNKLNIGKISLIFLPSTIESRIKNKLN